MTEISPPDSATIENNKKTVALNYYYASKVVKDASANLINQFKTNLDNFGNTYNTMTSLYLLIGALFIIPSLILISYLGLSRTLDIPTTFILAISLFVLSILLLYCIRTVLAYYFTPLFDSLEQIREALLLINKISVYWT